VQNENQVAMLNNIVTLPMIFTSATFYSLSAAPAWIKTIGYAFPFSYLIDGEHAALAANVAAALFPSLILLAFTALSLGLAVATFRWDPNTPIIRRVLHKYK
jgi:ABC-type multidrug transport system permease subunit